MVNLRFTTQQVNANQRHLSCMHVAYNRNVYTLSDTLASYWPQLYLFSKSHAHCIARNSAWWQTSSIIGLGKHFSPLVCVPVGLTVVYITRLIIACQISRPFSPLQTNISCHYKYYCCTEKTKTKHAYICSSAYLSELRVLLLDSLVKFSDFE